MPRYDFKCRVCGVTFEALTHSTIYEIPCVSCVALDTRLTCPGEAEEKMADRQLCYPASIQVH